jgi:hypothetical protein
MRAHIILYGNRVSPPRLARERGSVKRRVQIARSALDADTLAATVRYAAHPDRRSCGERRDFVTISTDLGVEHPAFSVGTHFCQGSALALFLASDESRCIMGVSLPVDAGSLLK